ncbi:hypothetical protein QQS21_011115 [Conoideocrella luteorostrata]|uniref:BHLH domain-containing protein n=1 Tax=Conoideocrella luteorostrata TaxID=1105319 RepID=A0AAJ0FNV2_9HYPO|nr:hypothetical protein QQS21_011115 [Conoideocrella luteorostrata]
MGSSQPESDPLLMFGYSVDSTQDNLFDGAPEPAPGAPLLTETDSKFLSSFFEDMTSNQYNMPSFGEGLNFSDAWLDLPPQFMGSSTSFGPQETSADFGFSNDQQNDLSRMLSAGSGMMPPPPPPPSQPQSYPQQHSDDVLTAAATLFQNGSRAGSSKNNNISSQVNDQNSVRRPSNYPVGHLRHQPMEEFKEENRRSSQVTEVDHTFTRWMWGTKEKTPVTKPALGDFQWGSDASFNDIQGYVPEPRKESVETMQHTQMKCLQCLEVNKSAANTRPSSPVNGQATSSNGDGSVYIKREEDPTAPPRKRRKSKNVRSTADEDDEEEDDATSSKSGRKRKTKSERSASGSEPPSETTASGRRRKSGANAAKPPRENLSEEQKRENHIRSEQKRRTLIKEGFDDLGVLVPGLRGGGFSKSTTLTMAADWLDELLAGNKALSMQASTLEQR